MNMKDLIGPEQPKQSRSIASIIGVTLFTIIVFTAGVFVGKFVIPTSGSSSSIDGFITDPISWGLDTSKSLEFNTDILDGLESREEILC